MFCRNRIDCQFSLHQSHLCLEPNGEQSSHWSMAEVTNERTPSQIDDLRHIR
jgi:hypothetical protein